ncbi:MAG: imidazole glycerol phosphate synthase subunit HisF [Bdellovibrionales bacterium]|nr:imidazole glycerol phosphate synthase subunit HisF [Bdellovibrionales bacterium]
MQTLPTLRLIARLDVKAPNLIKGIQLEGLRVLGDPYLFAKEYYDSGADELLYMDAVASLYNRNSLVDLVRKTASDIFIPFTVGGGIRTTEDVSMILRSGADKVAINTAAVRNPSIISDVAHRYGSQCMVLSIEAKRIASGRWEVFIDNGRERTGIDVIEWAQRGQELGAGEILLTSVDREGTRKGFDLDLLKHVNNAVTIPVIASGGMGELGHIREAFLSGIGSVAMADFLHYRRGNFKDIRDYAKQEGIPVRQA